MGLTEFQRLNDWVAFAMSAMVTGIGIMTISEKIALAGLLVGLVTAARAWLHRQRIERAQRRRNELISQILENTDRLALSESEQQALALLKEIRNSNETDY
ncbi:phage tail protein [Erwinia sp. STN24]|uniref:phage tail protein n=1 Tax=Erwinia sp. STN24 TaxID=3233996 RepID=UPI00351FDF49